MLLENISVMTEIEKKNSFNILGIKFEINSNISLKSIFLE